MVWYQRILNWETLKISAAVLAIPIPVVFGLLTIFNHHPEESRRRQVRANAQLSCFWLFTFAYALIDEWQHGLDRWRDWRWRRLERRWHQKHHRL